MQMSSVTIASQAVGIRISSVTLLHSQRRGTFARARSIPLVGRHRERLERCSASSTVVHRHELGYPAARLARLARLARSAY
jgi:hypothetical protein